jgi:hypothetical protein
LLVFFIFSQREFTLQSLHIFYLNQDILSTLPKCILNSVTEDFCNCFRSLRSRRAKRHLVDGSFVEDEFGNLSEVPGKLEAKRAKSNSSLPSVTSQKPAPLHGVSRISFAQQKGHPSPPRSASPGSPFSDDGYLGPMSCQRDPHSFTRPHGSSLSYWNTPDSMFAPPPAPSAGTNGLPTEPKRTLSDFGQCALDYALLENLCAITCMAALDSMTASRSSLLDSLSDWDMTGAEPSYLKQVPSYTAPTPSIEPGQQFDYRHAMEQLMEETAMSESIDWRNIPLYK